MKLKEILKEAFPNLYQIVYEYRTNKLIKQYKTNNQSELISKLKLTYLQRQGFSLNLSNPKRYTEKIQWRKIYGLTPQMSLLSDKYGVREWVSNIIGENYLIPLVGVWNRFDDIDFNLLPSSFVLKTNNASTTNLIVKNKDQLDYKLAKRKFDYWLNLEYWYAFGYEMQYQSIEPKIVAEKYIDPGKDEEDLKDYKFLCFQGKVKYIWVDLDRYHDHKRIIFDRNWNIAPFSQLYINSNIERVSLNIPKPQNLNKMIEIAEKLAFDFDHVRVDLYNQNGKIYFGEMTFTNGSGLEPILPDEWDFRLGKLWNLKTNV